MSDQPTVEQWRYKSKLPFELQSLDYSEIPAEQYFDVFKQCLKVDGLLIRFCDKQTPELCMIAVQENGLALDDVEEQTLDLCIAAVEQDGNAIDYVRDPDMQRAICTAYQVKGEPLYPYGRDECYTKA